MAFFYQYETTDIPIQLSDPDCLREAEKVVVTLYQQSSGIYQNFTNDEIEINRDDGIILLNLSQEQTAEFSPGVITIQVNIYYENSERDVTSTAKIRVLENLYQRIMP